MLQRYEKFPKVGATGGIFLIIRNRTSKYVVLGVIYKKRLLVERYASFQKPIKTKKNQQKQAVLQNK